MVENLPSSAGNWGSIAGWGTKILHAMGQLSPCALELMYHNERSCMHNLWQPNKQIFLKFLKKKKRGEQVGEEGSCINWETCEWACWKCRSGERSELNWRARREYGQGEKSIELTAGEWTPPFCSKSYDLPSGHVAARCLFLNHSSAGSLTLFKNLLWLLFSWVLWFGIHDPLF